jgi:hypothetical protein
MIYCPLCYKLVENYYSGTLEDYSTDDFECPTKVDFRQQYSKVSHYTREYIRDRKIDPKFPQYYERFIIDDIVVTSSNIIDAFTKEATTTLFDLNSVPIFQTKLTPPNQILDLVLRIRKIIAFS